MKIIKHPRVKNWFSMVFNHSPTSAEEHTINMDGSFALSFYFKKYNQTNYYIIN